MKTKNVIFAKNVKILENFRKFSDFRKFRKFRNFQKNNEIFRKIPKILTFLAKMAFLIFIFQNAPEFFLVNGFWNSKK